MMFSLLYTFCLHFYLINKHVFDYPDSRLSGLFTEVPASPDNRGSTVLLRNAVLYFRLAFLNAFSLPTVWWNPLSLHQQLMKDSKFGLTFWLNLNTPHVKTHVIPSTDWYICRHFRGKWKAHGVEVRLRSQFRKKPLKQYGTPWTRYRCVEIHSIFFDYLVIFRHYFTGDGKVSCILATISDWFPNIKI